jgi:hypothetical protein
MQYLPWIDQSNADGVPGKYAAYELVRGLSPQSRTGIAAARPGFQHGLEGAGESS